MEGVEGTEGGSEERGISRRGTVGLHGLDRNGVGGKKEGRKGREDKEWGRGGLKEEEGIEGCPVRIQETDIRIFKAPRSIGFTGLRGGDEA